MSAVRSDCWCGASSFREFGPDYLECTTCGTLVSQKGLSSDELVVVDDESDFYGKNYWLDHQSAELDQPDINARTRTDLPERNLYWLRTLLKYRVPSARAVELGCAHGSFVALMKQCGFQASGVEMSPWVVELGKKTFGIDIELGPVENLDIEPGSIDVIAMMDVMEHLPDPVATMSHCLSLLKPDGILLIQMPEFREGMQFETLVESKSSFMEQLKEDEHLYLYSKRSAVEFFHRLGADHVAFEPAVFAHYDMCIVVSRSPLQVNDQARIDASLLATPQGRIGLALLDMKDRYDRAPVLESEIGALHQQLQELYVRADAFSNERNLARAQLADLQGHFEEAERDRADRWVVIQSQGARISELEGQIHQRIQDLNDAHARIKPYTPAEWETHPAQAQLLELQGHLAAVERDRADRGALIEAQGRQISELEAMHHARLEELNALYAGNGAAAAIVHAHLEEMEARYVAAERDRHDRGAVIEDQGQRIAELEGQLHVRLGELSGLYAQLEEVLRKFAQVEQDRCDRAAVIQAQGQRVSELEGEVHRRLQELNGLYPALDSERARAAQLESLHANFQAEVCRRDAELEALRQRWWWKLGSFFKVL
ncbi:methyltransferase domain-containing protein [Lysobacter sp. TAF61]|uniref:class I SAM-dependent methyltransferase n=1 Tax=Lysobacter sp. TAF61 TaxID=3233072 RepID=UPI003F9A83AD